MKGFRPTGYGPSAGFKFPASMGFTGSTGSVTNVQPYVRRKAFANGGFVRQDTPRMKSAMVGDSGSAMVRRAHCTNELDEVSGGKTPIRPGFKKGGYTGGGALGAEGAGMPGALSNQDRNYLKNMAAANAKRKASPGAIKGKFAAAHGGKMRKADGGKVEKPKYMDAVKDRVKDLLGVGPSSTGMAKKAADKLEGRNKQIDDAVTEMETGRKPRDYARGGKARMTKC
jgi:hypothetical protein